MKHHVHDLISSIMHSPFTIGFAGSLVGVIVKGKLPFLQKLSMIVAGVACAGYLTPAVTLWFNMESVEYIGAVAFAVGLTGLQLTGGIIKLGEDVKNNPKKYLPTWKK